jgi:hypothetical protein
MASDFGRHLKDDELVSPGREPALPPELATLEVDSQQGVGRGLVCEVIQLGAGDAELPATALQLRARDPQQQLMQARQARLPLRPGAAEHPDPLPGIGIEPRRRRHPVNMIS